MLLLPAGDIVLFGQDWQLSEVELSHVEYFPAGQLMGLVAPALDAEPAGVWVQVEEP